VADEAVLAGVMSGTSMDGVTAAVARFRKRDVGYSVELLGFETVEYSDDLRARIRAATRNATAAEYNALNFELGALFADAAVAVMATAGVARADIDAIASHGHTIWHEPPKGTWQLGDGAVIAERTGMMVIEDFRVRDVAAGGQGAPLVTIADALLFGREDSPRALQNIGGIGNVTIVPRLGSTDGVRAFDTGPGVCIIDALARKLLNRAYDEDGRVAASGTPVAGVVEELLKHEYFRREPPKSTGRELFDDAYAVSLMSACRAANPECTDADIIATATELTVQSIALAYHKFIPEPIADVLLSGGGAKNQHLVRRLEALPIAPCPLPPFDAAFFPGEAKEAVAFAFLGFLHLRGEPGNVPAATGARAPRVLGKRIPA
jgi:anhydro-N-acetylmuramic acid kinase